MSIQSIVRSLLKSLGLKRKLANLLQVVATVASTIPGVAIYAGIIGNIASWLGLGGLVHAVKAKNLTLDIHTIAAFFSALLLAASNVPQLEAYKPLLQAIVAVLAAISTGKWLADRK